MFPVLQIGPLALPVPAFALLAGVWAGLSLAEKEAVRLKLNPEAVYNLVFLGLVAGLIGARLAYVVRYLSAYASDPLSVFALNPSALAPTEGALIGAMAAIVYGARRKLMLRSTLDALAPGLAIMGAAVAVAHLASGDAFGAAAHWPWSVYLWDEYRHPSQVYELIAALLVLGLAWRLRQQRSFAGFNFLWVVALSAIARISLEAFRGDSLVMVGGLRAAQVWGLVILAACLVTMRHWGKETGSWTKQLDV
jgi:phosphatidylglycerol:prolipoprotein diacylglycerol transferase